MKMPSIYNEVDAQISQGKRFSGLMEYSNRLLPTDCLLLWIVTSFLEATAELVFYKIDCWRHGLTIYFGRWHENWVIQSPKFGGLRGDVWGCLHEHEMCKCGVSDAMRLWEPGVEEFLVLCSDDSGDGPGGCHSAVFCGDLWSDCTAGTYVGMWPEKMQLVLVVILNLHIKMYKKWKVQY